MHHLMIVCCNSWFLLLRVLWKLISSDPGGFVLRIFLLLLFYQPTAVAKKMKWCNSYIYIYRFPLYIYIVYIVYMICIPIKITNFPSHVQ